MSYREKRERIHEAITEIMSDMDGTILTGWVLVTEEVHLDDEREFEILSSDATASRELPAWTIKGWLDYAKEEIEINDSASALEEDDEDDLDGAEG